MANTQSLPYTDPKEVAYFTQSQNTQRPSTLESLAYLLDHHGTDRRWADVGKAGCDWCKRKEPRFLPPWFVAMCGEQGGVGT